METLEKIIIPPIEFNKCTTRLALNKLTLVGCPYVLVTLNIICDAVKQIV